MPIPENTKLTAIPNILEANIEEYNSATGSYNRQYKNYIDARNAGIEDNGNLSSWAARDGAIAIQTLLNDFGMNSRNSKLVPHAAFQTVLSDTSPLIFNWIAEISLPLGAPPTNIVNATTGTNLSTELKILYNNLATPGSVTRSGGYVAASKTMHCLFPELAPMIDGAHTGISYYNIDQTTYTPPFGLDSWEEWIGEPINSKLNPSPRGAGRDAWQWFQFMAAIGVNQHIYELWQVANGNPGLQAFLALDPTPGTTGIPRIIDKSLW